MSAQGVYYLVIRTGGGIITKKVSAHSRNYAVSIGNQYGRCTSAVKIS